MDEIAGPAPDDDCAAPDWRARLTDAEYRVLRLGETEPPHVGAYVDVWAAGTYVCRACGAELFRSEAKFEAGCGWPSFHSPAGADRIRCQDDLSLPGRPRVETRCASCDSHLGHVFTGEGHDTPTDLRYCVNSIAVTLVEDERRA